MQPRQHTEAFMQAELQSYKKWKEDKKNETHISSLLHLTVAPNGFVCVFVCVCVCVSHRAAQV